MTEVWDMPNQLSQLDRIESKLDKLLEAKKPKARKDKDWKYPDWFESIWESYPKRVGSNPKRKAYHAINARCIQGRLPASTRQGAIRYADFCDVTGKTGTEYVMQAATFFGPDKHYENDWTVPTQAETPPKVNDQLVAWAVNKGYREPYAGEEYSHYRTDLMKLHGVQS